MVAQKVKNLPVMQETWVQSLGQEDPLEKGMATHSSILAWRIPWTEQSGRLWSMESQRVGHNWSALAHKCSPYISTRQKCLMHSSSLILSFHRMNSGEYLLIQDHCCLSFWGHMNEPYKWGLVLQSFYSQQLEIILSARVLLLKQWDATS